MTLAPRLAMACSIEREEPPPISIIAMTAAIPMIIPRQVSTERIMLRRRACNAVRRIVRMVLTMGRVSSTSAEYWKERVFCCVLSGFGDFPSDDLLPFAQRIRDHGGVGAIRNPKGHLNRPGEFAFPDP